MTPAVYAESSAVLAWLLDEQPGPAVHALLEAAEAVVLSQLTLVESARGIRKAERDGKLSREKALSAYRVLDDAAGHWIILDLVGDVLERAKQEFPAEPVRSLDALHLASALVFNNQLGKVAMLSLDDRIRTNAVAMGLALA